MAKPRAKQQVRIIAGEWRGRRLSFPDIDGLRPTTDRVRETLFNWLQAYLPGATCLDLFAGSGALGFEAASRGAKSVQMVEKHPEVYQALQASKSALTASNVVLLNQDAIAALPAIGEGFDIVFADPPFQLNVLGQLCEQLDERSIVKVGGLIYLECPQQQAVDLPTHWQVLKEKKAGNVIYRLVKRGE